MRQSGFSLIEIMVVVVIMGLLAAAIIPNLVGALEDTNDTRIKNDFRSIETAIKIYYLKNFRYPSSEEGLQILLASNNSENRAYLDKLPTDPWEAPYLYLSPGDENRPFEIYTLGSDQLRGGTKNAKDYFNWEI